MKNMKHFLASMIVNAAITVAMTFAMTLVSAKSHAQMWGAGVYGGMSQCPYQVDVGDAATDIADAIDQLNEDMSNLKEKQSDAQKEAREAKRDYESGRDTVSRYGLSKESVSLLEKHISSPKTCGQYDNFLCKDGKCSASPTKCNTSKDGADSKGGSSADAGSGWQCGTEDTSDFPGWDKACDVTKAGYVDAAKACDFGNKIDSSKSYAKFDRSKCVDGLSKWQKSYDVWKKKDAESNDLKQQIADIKSRIKVAQKDYKKEVKEYQREQQKSQTEGGCVQCMLAGNGYVSQPKRSNTGEIIANVGLGIAAMYFGQQQNQYISDNNAKLGFQSQSYPSLGYGFPYFMGALSGAMNGGSSGGGGGFYGGVGGGVGSGAFGCGSGMGGTGSVNGSGGMMGPFGMGGMYGPQGGAFGYPQNMYGSPMGGGMYNMGMGPWGMNGPNGGGGMGNMGGMMANGSVGFMSPGGYMMGYPASGGMSGYGNMMGNGGYMMSGGAMMNGGAMMGGMSGYGNMMGGGAMMGGGTMMSTGAMMGDGGAAQMQMYQQQMQMQMQQYQQQMDMQKRLADSQIAKAKTLTSLQTELQSLMYRIQQVQMSTGTNGVVGFDYSTQGTISYQPSGNPIPVNSTTTTGPSQR